MVFLQEHYNLTVCGLFYGSAVLYNGHEERLKQRYVHSGPRYSDVLANSRNLQQLLVCLDANGRMRCFL